jgi:imidazolonepropionase-like amidohydrolase
MPLKQYIAAARTGRISKAHLDSTGYEQEFQVACLAAKRLRGLGVRVVPGGEYGLADSMPHGANAMDLELFVEDLGCTPMEAICAATRDAAYLSGMERDLGTLEPGRIADLLVVDGDPLADIAVLQRRHAIAIVMKDGEIQARGGTLLPL